MLQFIRKCRLSWQNKRAALKAHRPVLYHVLEWTQTIVVALVLALVIRKYVLQVSVIPSESMVPTLQVGDRLFVNKYVYRFKLPKRGDIVVFRSVSGEKKDLVKRCVALPGDTVSMKRGVLYINGRVLALSGVDIRRDYDFFDPVFIPEGHYFMLGDNRANSQDSRFWGMVPENHLLGQAIYTFWPLSRMQLLR